MGKKNLASHGALAWLGLISLFFLIFAWENIQATRFGYRVEQTRREIRSFKITNEYLRFRLQNELSPARLHFVAQERLGMVAPDPDKIVVLGDTYGIRRQDVAPPAPSAYLPGQLLRKLRAGLEKVLPRLWRASLPLEREACKQEAGSAAYLHRFS